MKPSRSHEANGESHQTEKQNREESPKFGGATKAECQPTHN